MPTTDSVILTPAFLDALVVILSAPTVRMELMDLADDQCFTAEQIDAITDLTRAVRDISGLETDDLQIFLDLHLDADGEVRGRADTDADTEGASATFGDDDDGSGEEEMPAFDADVDIEDDDGEEEEEEEEDPDSSNDGDDDAAEEE